MTKRKLKSQKTKVKAKAKTKVKAKAVKVMTKEISQAQPASPPADEPVVVVSEAELQADRERKEKAEAEAKAEAERIAKLGLVEIPVKGTSLTLLGLPDPTATPATMEQRVEMAKRLNEVGPRLPKYVQRYFNPELPGKSVQEIVDHAFEFGEGQQKKKFTTQVDPKQAFEGALKVIAKHDPQSAAAAALAGKKFKPAKVDSSKAEKGKGKSAAPPPPPAKKKGKGISPPQKVPPGGFNKSNKPATSGELIRARIMEHKMTDEQIAAESRKLFEGRNTQVSDVRWNRGQMRKVGIDAPDPVGGEPQKSRGK